MLSLSPSLSFVLFTGSADVIKEKIWDKYSVAVCYELTIKLIIRLYQ